MQLELLQADFAAALRNAQDAAKILPALMRETRSSERLALYRANITAAWHKALTNAFPVTRALVGDEFFALTARAYAQAYPSASGDLNSFGERFAAFVATFEGAKTLAYLGDIAALEWHVHRAYYAADADVLGGDRIANLSAHELLTARFALHPACAWQASQFPIASIWRAHQPQATTVLPTALDRAECALVVRPHWRAEVVESSAAEIAALAQLRAGEDIGSAIGIALALDAHVDFSHMLVRWLDLAILVDIR